jgi:uncharacterized membrane-anchored protein
MNAIAAFWFAYIVTRPLGASFADYISKPRSISGIDFGDGPTTAVMLVGIVLLVAYLAVARRDIQRTAASPLGRHRAAAAPGSRPAEELEALDLQP